MKKLSPKDLDAIKMYDLEVKAARAEALLEAKKVELLEAKLRIFTNEITAQKSRAEHVQRIQNDKIEERKEFVKSIGAKRKLKAGWGFDPDSGEIKED